MYVSWTAGRPPAAPSYPTYDWEILRRVVLEVGDHLTAAIVCFWTLVM